METIGERALQAIRERSEMNKTKFCEECKKINATKQVAINWGSRGLNPNAYFLQQMALAGYDVIWILTGKENKNAKN